MRQQATFNVIELMGCTQQVSVKQISYTLAPYVLKQTQEGPEQAMQTASAGSKMIGGAQ